MNPIKRSSFFNPSVSSENNPTDAQSVSNVANQNLAESKNNQETQINSKPIAEPEIKSKDSIESKKTQTKQNVSSTETYEDSNPKADQPISEEDKKQIQTGRNNTEEIKTQTQTRRNNTEEIKTQTNKTKNNEKISNTQRINTKDTELPKSVKQIPDIASNNSTEEISNVTLPPSTNTKISNNSINTTSGPIMMQNSSTEQTKQSEVNYNNIESANGSTKTDITQTQLSNQTKNETINSKNIESANGSTKTDIEPMDDIKSNTTSVKSDTNQYSQSKTEQIKTDTYQYPHPKAGQPISSQDKKQIEARRNKTPDLKPQTSQNNNIKTITSKDRIKDNTQESISTIEQGITQNIKTVETMKMKEMSDSSGSSSKRNIRNVSSSQRSEMPPPSPNRGVKENSTIIVNTDYMKTILPSFQQPPIWRRQLG